MKRFQGKAIVKGTGKGPAMFTDKAMNWTAAFTKTENLIPGKKAEVRDRHHPWFKKSIKGRVLFIPACIGSTHTGLVLLDLVRLQRGPSAIIVGQADPLLVSGVLLSEVWYDRVVPIVEHDIDALEAEIVAGAMVEITENGEILVD